MKEQKQEEAATPVNDQVPSAEPQSSPNPDSTAQWSREMQEATYQAWHSVPDNSTKEELSLPPPPPNLGPALVAENGDRLGPSEQRTPVENGACHCDFDYCDGYCSIAVTHRWWASYPWLVDILGQHDPEGYVQAMPRGTPQEIARQQLAANMLEEVFVGQWVEVTDSSRWWWAAWSSLVEILRLPDPHAHVQAMPCATEEERMHQYMAQCMLDGLVIGEWTDSEQWWWASFPFLVDISRMRDPQAYVEAMPRGTAEEDMRRYLAQCMLKWNERKAEWRDLMVAWWDNFLEWKRIILARIEHTASGSSDDLPAFPFHPFLSQTEDV